MASKKLRDLGTKVEGIMAPWASGAERRTFFMIWGDGKDAMAQFFGGDPEIEWCLASMVYSDPLVKSLVQNALALADAFKREDQAVGGLGHDLRTAGVGALLLDDYREFWESYKKIHHLPRICHSGSG